MEYIYIYILTPEKPHPTLSLLVKPSFGGEMKQRLMDDAFLPSFLTYLEFVDGNPVKEEMDAWIASGKLLNADVHPSFLNS